MSRGFLRRQDVGYEKRANPRNLYGVKHFQAPNPTALETLVNDYLFALPTAQIGWNPHLVEVHHLISGTGNNTAYHCWLTIYVDGTVNTPPTL